MKTQLSSIDIHFLVKEFQELINSRVDKIFGTDKKDILLQLYKTGLGKILLRINAPKFICVTKEKQEYEEVSPFCTYLRKKLTNCIITKVEQKNFERIIEIVLERKEEKYFLMVELFGRGNIILLENNKVLIASEYKQWKDRKILPKEEYILPKKQHNFLTMNKTELRELAAGQDKEIVKTLAIDLGLGGINAEEICENAKLDKNKKELMNDEIDYLFMAIDNFRNSKLRPAIIRDNAMIDAVPFVLHRHKEYTQEYFETFNEAIEKFFKWAVPIPVKKSDYDARIDKIKMIIEQQESTMKQSQEKAENAQKKAETIYNNYLVVTEILEQIRKAREKYSWQEIKDKLKGHKTVKGINEAEGKVTIEVQ